MDQNTSVDNDLQKAIDDITKTTNVDPVFTDPVAAPSSIPEGDTGVIEPVGPFPDPVPEPVVEAPAPEPVAEAPAEPTEPVIPEAPAPEPPVIEEPVVDPTIPQNLTTAEVKKAALRDLLPLLDKVHMDDVQKFNIYKDIFEELKDYTVLEPAYQAARNIADEEKRAESLLYLVESIDRM